MQATKNPDKKKVSRLVELNRKNRKTRTPENLFSALSKGDKGALSEAITLLESSLSKDKNAAKKLIRLCLPKSGKSIRIGITGVPGVGKSTFIESFGMHLIQHGKKVAVLAIDPSSEKTGGSILGDKTRMTTLSVHKNAFIRPSASKGALGGVAQRTRESILVCEAAGFDVILIETVGVGQSEIAVHSMSDFFLLLMLAGAGDELQGIKRGIMEMADALIITKADGDNVKKANLARAQFQNALHLFPANENGWITRVETVSATENKGIDQVWNHIQSFENHTKCNGYFEMNRQNQQRYWMHEAIKENLLNDFFSQKSIIKKIALLESKMAKGEITSFEAAKQLTDLHRKNGKQKI